MMMEVTTGKYRVKFFLLMIMSPGSLPTQGILSPIKRRMPIAIIKTPRRMSIFPKGPISNSQSSNVKVQMTKECQMDDAKTNVKCQNLFSFLIK